MAVIDRLKMAWNAFSSSEANNYNAVSAGMSTSYSPQRVRPFYSNEKTIISSIYTRIGIDVASVGLRHVKLDDQNRYSEDVKSRLNMALTIEPNLDQGPRAFRQDIVQTLFDNGCAAIVPIDTTVDPSDNSVFDIYSMRVGVITAWYPSKVRVSLYNENLGVQKEIILDKRVVTIIENPLFGVMNEPNSTLKRLVRKLSLLDAVDEASSSGKLDLIIQLPYVIKSEARANQAEARRKAIEEQLTGSKYGVAYTDGTEKIVQLNRPVENTLLKQVEFLTNMLYAQLGLTPSVLDGTADEATMLNYYNRTVEPILTSIVEGMNRSFFGPVGTRKNERVMFFRDPFKLTPLTNIAEIADKFTRNEIFSSNEIRQFIGVQPSTDPKADKLVNSNMPEAVTGTTTDQTATPADAQAQSSADADAVNSGFDEIDNVITSIFNDLGGSP